MYEYIIPLKKSPTVDGKFRNTETRTIENPICSEIVHCLPLLILCSQSLLDELAKSRPFSLLLGVLLPQREPSSKLQPQ